MEILDWLRNIGLRFKKINYSLFCNKYYPEYQFFYLFQNLTVRIIIPIEYKNFITIITIF